MSSGQTNRMRQAAMAFTTAGVLALTSAAGAAVIHTDSLPSDRNPAFAKDTHAFMYLEGENVERGAANTFANAAASAADASRTFYRNDGNPSTDWTGGASYNNNYYGAYGGNTDLSNINAYWTNLTTGLPLGTYDVFVRAFPASGGTQTYSFYAGEDRAAADAGGATVAGTTTTSTQFAGTERWYKIGSFALTSGMDSFRLKVNTSASRVSFDTVLLTSQSPVPEPATALLGAAGLCLLAGRRRLAVR